MEAIKASVTELGVMKDAIHVRNHKRGGKIELLAGAHRLTVAQELDWPTIKVVCWDWDARDPRTGAPQGIDRGWDYAPGASAADTILAFRDKLEKLHAQPATDLIESWLDGPFKRWFEDPRGAWPLARLSDADAQKIGSQRRVAELSAETLAKQRRHHPELTVADYTQAQATINLATHRVQDGENSLIFVRDDPSAPGYVLVVKATRTGQGLFVTSFRRLTSNQTKRDAEIARLMRKGDGG